MKPSNTIKAVALSAFTAAAAMQAPEAKANMYDVKITGAVLSTTGSPGYSIGAPVTIDMLWNQPVDQNPDSEFGLFLNMPGSLDIGSVHSTAMFEAIGADNPGFGQGITLSTMAGSTSPGSLGENFVLALGVSDSHNRLFPGADVNDSDSFINALAGNFRLTDHYNIATSSDKGDSVIKLDDITIQSVPEPPTNTFALLGLTMTALAVAKRRADANKAKADDLTLRQG